MAGFAGRELEEPSRQPGVAPATVSVLRRKRSWLMAAAAVVVVIVVALAIVVTTSGSPGSPSGRLKLVDRLVLPQSFSLFGAAVSPDGSTVYVTGDSDSGPPGGLYAIDVATGQVRTVAEGVGNLAVSLAVSPDGRLAYVTDHYGDALTPVDLAGGRDLPRIAVGMQPASVAIAGHGSTAYTVSDSGHTVVPVNLAARRAGPAITIAGPAPRSGKLPGLGLHASIAVSPDGGTVYVTVPDRGVVVPIDVATSKAGRPLAAGRSPRGIAITPDGKVAYVTNANCCTTNGVAAINLSTGRLSRPVNHIDLAFLGPIAIAPNGQLAYVGGGDVNLTAIDLTTNEPLNPLRIAPDALSIALTRAGTRAYIVTEREVDVVQLSR
jgi:DNA-binding beta-propeller fold protein YncE